MFDIFNVMFVIVPIFILGMFIFTFSMILSPKLRGKFMARQLRATKYMLDESRDDLANLAETASDISINAKKNILDKHEDVLRDMATREANIYKDGISVTTKAIKDGLVGDSVYCKHCGALIDEDSKFCKKCGKKL